VLNDIAPEGYDVDPESGQVTLLNWRARVLTS